MRKKHSPVDLDVRNLSLRDFLHWRGIEDLNDMCSRCSGSGGRVYPSTSMWRGGVGGQQMTHGVCDRCWGSGNEARPWVNLRTLEKKP